MILLFVIQPIGPVLAVIGWILVLVAVSNISEVVGDKTILKDVLVAAILAIIGIVVSAIILLGSVFRFFGQNGLNFSLFPGSLRNFNSTSFSSGNVTGIGTLIVSVLVGLAVLWVFYLVSAIFLRRGFEKIASRLNVKMFATAALLYLIGAALTVVIIGLIVVFVADILMVVAFFSMPDDTSLEPPPRPSVIPPPPPPVSPN